MKKFANEPVRLIGTLRSKKEKEEEDAREGGVVGSSCKSRSVTPNGSSAATLSFTTTDGVLVLCNLSSSFSNQIEEDFERRQREGKSEDDPSNRQVGIMCGILSSPSSSSSSFTLNDAFFTPLGNELNSSQADEIIGFTHHDFFSPLFSPSSSSSQSSALQRGED
ncbi:replication factor a protein 3 protein [Cystoisospora suis]|uniref:Replication factor a protein 3 protein n=1 Tax=Cystoisospora suis TaxID=483139 RepID=A0A2C6KH59_9APIC|nr:replication factor a protein 3 protein [Cystoisospora suis]